MPKLFSISVGIMVSFLLGMTGNVVLAGNSDELIDKIFSEAGFKESFKNDPEELERISTQKDAFNNLYLFVYQNVKDGPKDATIKELADRTSFSKNEIEKIVFEGNTEVIAENKKKLIERRAEEVTEEYEESEENEDLSFEEYLRETYAFDYDPVEGEFGNVLNQKYVSYLYSKIRDTYEEELEFQSQNKKLAMEALASEMFMNGDKTDSGGIDLLADLDMINEIIFGEPISYPNRDPEGVSLSSQSSFQTDHFEDKSFDGLSDDLKSDDLDKDIFLSSESEVSESAENDSTNSESAEDVDEGEYETDYVDEGEDNGETENTDACFEDENLRAALDDYADSEANEPGEEDPEDYVTQGQLPDDLGDDDEDDDDENTGNAGSDGDEKTDEIMEAISVEAGNWGRFSLPCDEIFCIKVNLVTENNNPEVEGSSPSGNFIANHVAYINKRMKETLGKSMTPSKVSTNWFEDATCKQAGLLATLDLHVYGVPQPIILDPADDTNEKADKRNEEMVKALEAAESRYGETTRAENECEGILNMSDYSDSGTSLEEALSDCEEAYSRINEEISSTISKYIFDSKADVSNSFYEQVSSELVSFYKYFESFRSGLKKTYQKDPAPLPSIVSKSFCK